MFLKDASLPPAILAVVKDQKTEHPFSGQYNDFATEGTFLCRRCGLALFRSQDKFHSGCGWPSFDQDIKLAVKQLPDPDGERTEIVCARCQAHLGHVFTGEGFTAKNLRHCVNSASLDFVADLMVTDTAEALFAGGCFWGIEHYFKQLPGVLKTEVGYSGGSALQPTYQAVCSGKTGHVEAIRVVYDNNKLTYSQVAKYFFEIHDPTQANGQGPDIGSQYQSVIFYYNQAQQDTAEALIAELKGYGYQVATKVWPVTIFWQAEDYHQDYYAKTHAKAYCHRYEQRFPK